MNLNQNPTKARSASLLRIIHVASKPMQHCWKISRAFCSLTILPVMRMFHPNSENCAGYT
jgi:hypothetical protein